MDLSAFCVVQTTIDDEAKANEIAAALVARKLAACVQIAEATSHYVWQGEAAKTKEFLLAAKARRADFDAIAAVLRALHSYELPEIIAIPIVAGDPAYLDWARRETERG
jgi:periplasmic divalent cation tolerance protein